MKLDSATDKECIVTQGAPDFHQLLSKSSMMKVLNLTIDTEQFWINYCDFKSSLQLPLPNSTFKYKCICKKRLYLFKNGDIFLDVEPTISIPDLIKREKEILLDHHFNTGCGGEVFLDKKVGMPESLCIFFKDINADTIKEFQFEDNEFYPNLIVHSIRRDCPVMVLFMNKSSTNQTMIELFTKNFENYLNVPNQEAEKNTIEQISDDEAVNKNQQLLPRLTGGGRKMLQDFKYICQWCSDETLKQKTKGRFMEIKNYRDHFRRVHQDIPFSEFLNKVERDEPKWQCKICRQKMSVGNQLRHQIICRPPKYLQKQKGKDDTSSDSDSDSDSDSQSEHDTDTQKTAVSSTSLSN